MAKIDFNLLNKDYIDIYKNYSLKNYINLSKDETVSILAIRNQKKIREAMFDTSIINLEDHDNFISLLSSKKEGYWVVFREAEIIGSISLKGFDKTDISFVGGSFLKDTLLNSGLGILLNYLIRIVAFDKIKCAKIKAFIRLNNSGALRTSRVFENFNEHTISFNNEDYFKMEFLKSKWDNDTKMKISKYVEYIK